MSKSEMKRRNVLEGREIGEGVDEFESQCPKCSELQAELTRLHEKYDLQYLVKRNQELEAKCERYERALNKIAQPTQTAKITGVDVFNKSVTIGNYESIYDERAELAREALNIKST